MSSERISCFCSQLGREKRARERKGWSWSSWKLRKSMSNGVFVVNEQTVSSWVWLWCVYIHTHTYICLLISSTMSGLFPSKHLLQEKVTALRYPDLQRGREENNTGVITCDLWGLQAWLIKLLLLNPSTQHTLQSLAISRFNYKDQICYETLLTLILPAITAI